MKLEHQLTSLVLSKRLRELNVKQESYFYWDWHSDTCYGVKFVPFSCPGLERYSAFSVAELGEMLPELFCIDNEWYLYTENRLNGFWGASYSTVRSIDYFPSISDKKNADSRAMMIVYLIENNLVAEEWKKKWLIAS
jgi:hypothetical protein